MHLEKHYFRRFFLGIYLVMFIIFCIFAMHPQDVEANSSLILQAPSINLESKIKIIKLNEDYTLTAPDRIAGLYYAAKNNTFIIGHSSTIFSKLHQLKINDLLTLDNEQYRITKIASQNKNEIKMSRVLEPKSTPTLTLMTCYGEKITNNDYTKRLIITAEKIKI